MVDKKTSVRGVKRNLQRFNTLCLPQISYRNVLKKEVDWKQKVTWNSTGIDSTLTSMTASVFQQKLHVLHGWFSFPTEKNKTEPKKNTHTKLMFEILIFSQGKFEIFIVVSYRLFSKLRNVHFCAFLQVYIKTHTQVLHVLAHLARYRIFLQL